MVREAKTVSFRSQRAADSPPALPTGGGVARVAVSAESSSALVDRARILSLLYDIAKELTSILDFEELLRTVGDRVKLLVDYDVFNVMLLNEESQRLQHVLSLQFDQRIQIPTTLALGEGLCGTAALERKPIRVNQVGSDARYIKCKCAPDVKSELVVPLIVKDRLLGVLDLESVEPNAFTEDHEQMLATLAATVAIALENARLYEQLRRAEQRRSEDLEKAREVQLLLLPTEMPKVPGIEIAVRYQPAQELGGDFYDFLRYADGRLAIAVGDVAGKGPAAALFASLGVGMLREHAVHAPSSPAEMLADLNGHLLMPGGGRFITMAFGVYDAERGELSLASAGFPRPLLVRGHHASGIDIAGLPLGMFRNTVYESVSLQLQPGDVVVFCSDGIHEQTNALEEEFSVDRLLAHLANNGDGSTADRIAEDIIRAVEEYAGEISARRQPRDDRTIVVLRVVAPTN